MKARAIFSFLCVSFIVLALSPALIAVEGGKSIRMVSAGAGGFQRIAQWLAINLFKNNKDLKIWFAYSEAGREFRNGVVRLQKKEADVAVVNSRAVAAMAMRGRGLFQEKFSGLRGISIFPQHDWCFFAVDASLGVSSFEELKVKKVPLKFTTGYSDDGISFLAFEVLRRHGISREDLKQWGSEFIEGTPNMSIAAMSSGRANAVFQEGAFLEGWKEIARKRPLKFLTLDPKVSKEIEEDLGIMSLQVPAQYYPGQEHPLSALNFSDFLLCVREDMSDDLAYELARIATEERHTLIVEDIAQADAATLANTSPVPLHPGAERYYKEKHIF